MHNAESFERSPSWGSTTYHGERGSRSAEPARQPAGAGCGPATDGARKHLAYAPGLDGVRAIAVTAVVVFHLGATWLTGGFLGVDVFFTLSGFLITSILLTEFYARGRIDIKNFYLRRARRLLPALFTMLATITLLTWLFARDEMYRLRGDVIAALTYCTNWTQIVWNRGYFDQLGRPSLLQHLWSLAVEEQFYVLWPLILVAGLAMRKRWGVLAIPVVLTAVSLVLMAGLFHAGQDPARVYYGTDTHISPMLIGATLAIIVGMRRNAGLDQRTSRRPAHRRHRRPHRPARSGLGRVHINYYSAGLYRGGYLLVGIGSAALIYAAARAGTITARLLGWAPLVWIGQRSYAIYLWHWPILMLSRPGVDIHWPKPVVIVLQVAAMLIASDLSFRYIERPIRSRGFLNFLRGGHRGRARRRGSARAGSNRSVTTGAVLTGVLALVAATLVSAPSAAPAGIQVDHSKRITIKIPSTSPTSHAAQAPPPRRQASHSRIAVGPRRPSRSSRSSRRSRARCGCRSSATRRA